MAAAKAALLEVVPLSQAGGSWEGTAVTDTASSSAMDVCAVAAAVGASVFGTSVRTSTRGTTGVVSRTGCCSSGPCVCDAEGRAASFTPDSQVLVAAAVANTVALSRVCKRTWAASMTFHPRTSLGHPLSLHFPEPQCCDWEWQCRRGCTSSVGAVLGNCQKLQPAPKRVGLFMCHYFGVCASRLGECQRVRSVQCPQRNERRGVVEVQGRVMQCQHI